jgi:hypothetical protein
VTAAHDPAAKTRGRHTGAGDGSVPQYSGLLGPRATLTEYGFKTAKNATKHSAAMPNAKKLRKSFIVNS